MVDNSEGYLVLRQTPQQNPYPLQTLRSPIPPHPKTHLLLVRLSRGQDPSIQLGRESQTKENHGYGQDANDEGGAAEVQERFPDGRAKRVEGTCKSVKVIRN
ncbi:MAG: hypothetical protein Q9177_000100 [Variospora cf. flavescens]